MNLATLQTEFQDELLSTECNGASWIADSKITLSAKQRMGIYHNAYRVRLVEVLLDNFEHTGMYLGEDWFYKLGYAYVEKTNSTHHNISEYGKYFPDFLAEKLPKDIEVSELALLDWRLRRAFDGFDSVVLTGEDLQQQIETQGTETRLKPVPTLSVVTHQYNTLDIWQAVNNEEASPTVENLENPTDILIWRKGFSPHFRSLTPIESTAINYLLSGDTFDQIGESLTAEFPQADITNELGLMLQRWIQDEVLAQYV